MQSSLPVLEALKPQMVKRLHEALLKIQRNPPARYGICDAYLTEVIFSPYSEESTYHAYDVIRLLMRRWPRYSGDESFPVPFDGMLEDLACFWPNMPEAMFLERHGVYSVNEVAFVAYAKVPDLWGDHAYGNSRRELLAYLLEQTK